MEGTHLVGLVKELMTKQYILRNACAWDFHRVLASFT